MIRYLIPQHNSERKEYSVFRELLRMVPGLEARLMEISEQEVVDIADLVIIVPVYLPRLYFLPTSLSRFKKVSMVQERMTPRA